MEEYEIVDDYEIIDEIIDFENKSIESMRIRSGTISSTDKLTSVIYSLLRDYIQPGDLEALVQEAEKIEEVVYTNGWLAQYAQDLSKRLK